MGRLFRNSTRRLSYIWLPFLVLVCSSSALPLCTDLRAPLPSKSPLSFCSNKAYKDNGCCDRKADSDIESIFQSMNVSDTKCAGVLKEILCSKCDQFAADLFLIQNQGHHSVPLLCNSTQVANNSMPNSMVLDYCSQVWDACQNVSIFNSPFVSSLQWSVGATANRMHPKLIDLWKSKDDFCTAFGCTSTDGNTCFSGSPFLPNVTNKEPPPQGVCLEKIGNGVYLNMFPHPDGSNRVFLGTQTGLVYLATLPDEKSSGPLELDESKPFIDLSDQVFSDFEFGLMGLAFHPDFLKNGRFFASFNCDKTKELNCLGRCACNADVGCDPSQLAGTGTGAMPCQFHTVIAEYTVNGSSTSPSEATTAHPTEVRRIFTMGLPFRNHHGGQIVFGPTDNYLYFMMGDGGNLGDPFNFSQNKKSLLGKIMRLDVDTIPSSDEADDSLWGNYSIPPDNPFAQDKDLLPEIWALGLRNPWRCSFDSQKPTYFLCGDVGQEMYEEVDLITKGGNYGWRVYEGNDLYTPPWSPGGNTIASSIQPIFPVMGYYHKSIDSDEDSGSVTGGYVSRSQIDPCLYGRYFYADLFGSMWVGTEDPIGSGNYSNARVAYDCSARSPLSCTYTAGSKTPNLGWIYSFGEDNGKTIYLLTASGVYRVTDPTNCNFVCKNALVAERPASGPEGSSSSSASSSTTNSLTNAFQRCNKVWIWFLLVIVVALS